MNRELVLNTAKWLFFFLFISILSVSAQSKLYCIKSSETGQLRQHAIADSLKWQETLQQWQDEDQHNGFLLAGTDSITLGDTLTAWYFKGQRFYWLHIKADSISQNIVYQFNLQEFENKPLSVSRWIRAKQRVVSTFRENGYPNANLSLQNIEIKHDSVSAKLFFQSGNFVRFGDITVLGDTVLSNKFITRQIGFRKGAPYSEEIVKNIDSRLSELPYIQLVKSSEVYRQDDLAKAYVFIRKKNISQFSGILGVANSAKVKSSLLLTGELNLNLINTLKKGEELNLEWRKLQEQTQELTTNVVFPYILGSALGFDASFMLYKRDTTYLTTNPTVGIRYQTKGSSYVRLFFDAKSSSVLLQNLVSEDVGSVNQYLYGAEYYTLNLDNQFNPYKGYKLNISAGTGTRTLKSIDKTTSQTENRQQYKLDASLYIPLAQKLTFKLRNYSAYLSGNNHVLNEMYRIGGINNLRGVEENSLRVSSFSVQTAEIRLIIESSSALFLFVDQAWYEQRLKTGYYTDKPIGVGAGMQFQTKAGIFSLQYAAGKQKGTTLSFTQAKVHIGYISRF